MLDVKAEPVSETRAEDIEEKLDGDNKIRVIDASYDDVV